MPIKSLHTDDEAAVGVTPPQPTVAAREGQWLIPVHQFENFLHAYQQRYHVDFIRDATGGHPRFYEHIKDRVDKKRSSTDKDGVQNLHQTDLEPNKKPKQI